MDRDLEEVRHGGKIIPRYGDLVILGYPTNTVDYREPHSTGECSDINDRNGGRGGERHGTSGLQKDTFELDATIDAIVWSLELGTES